MATLLALSAPHVQPKKVARSVVTTAGGRSLMAQVAAVWLAKPVGITTPPTAARALSVELAQALTQGWVGTQSTRSSLAGWDSENAQ